MARRKRSSSARGLGSQHRAARLVVLERDGYVCHWCGGPATEADHLVPRASGGTGDPANMVAACKVCNARRGGELGAARRRRSQRHPFFRSGNVWTPRQSPLSPSPPAGPDMSSQDGA